MNFTYNLSETEYLVFKTQMSHFELYSGHEAAGELKKIANYKGGNGFLIHLINRNCFGSCILCLRQILVRHLNSILGH